MEGAGHTDLSLLQIVNVLLRHRMWVIGLPLIAFVVAATLTLVKPRTYTASGSFLPQGADASGGISGVAAQLGLSISGSASAPPPRFYADLLKSPTILRRLADSSYAIGGIRKSLSEHLDIDTSSAPSPAAVRVAVVARLKGAIRADADPRTGVVSFGVSTETPALSRLIATNLLSQLDQFTVETRRTRAAAEQRFTEERLGAASSTLRSAESRLQGFLQRNRVYQTDPQLAFEYDRLAREVRLQEGLYTSLAQTLERASIESTRNTPTITMVELPVEPIVPDGRGIVIRCLVATLLGLLFGIFAALVREYVMARRQHAPLEYDEFAGLRREMTTELRHPLRAIRGAFSSEQDTNLS